MFNLDNILFQSVRNSIASSVGIFGSIPTWIGSTTGQNGGFLAVTPVKYYNWGQLVVWGGIMGLKLSGICCEKWTGIVLSNNTCSCIGAGVRG